MKKAWPSASTNNIIACQAQRYILCDYAPTPAAVNLSVTYKVIRRVIKL